MVDTAKVLKQADILEDLQPKTQMRTKSARMMREMVDHIEDMEAQLNMANRLIEHYAKERTK